MKINIQISEMDKEFIKYAKSHFKDQKRFVNKSIIQGYGILYEKYYGVSTKKYKNWKYVILDYLYILLLKIKDDEDEMQIHLGLTHTLLKRNHDFQKRNSIDRGLEYLHSKIAFTSVITNDENGNEIKRFNLY